MDRPVARRVAIGLLIAGVVAAQWSLAFKWDDPSTGVIVVLYEAPLVVAVIVGAGAERRTRRPPTDGTGGDGAAPRPVLTGLAGLAALGLTAVCVGLSVATVTPPAFRSGVVPGAGCGSAIDLVDYDCRHYVATGRIYVVGLAALFFAGWTMSALRLRRVRIPPVVAGIGAAVGGALLVGAASAMPSGWPTFGADGAPVENDAFQNWALAGVVDDVHTAGVMLVLAVVLLAPLAVSRWDHGVRVPVPAVFVGIATVVLAGVVVMATTLVPLVAYFMDGG